MIYMLQKIKSDLRRARIRHEKSYAKVERLREKLADLCCADRFVGGVSAAMRFFGKLCCVNFSPLAVLRGITC